MTKAKSMMTARRDGVNECRYGTPLSISRFAPRSRKSRVIKTNRNTEIALHKDQGTDVILFLPHLCET